MAYSLYGREVFRATANGQDFTFTCYGQGTSYGFRHICTLGYNDTTVARYIKDDIIAKACYYNRTWESFKYETVLRKAINNLDVDEDTRAKLKAIIIDKTAQDEHEKCEAEVEAFKALYDKTSDSFKDRIANSGIIMQNDDDVKAVKGLMMLDIVMNN